MRPHRRHGHVLCQDRIVPRPADSTRRLARRSLCPAPAMNVTQDATRLPQTDAEPRLRTSTGWPCCDSSTTTTSSPPQSVAGDLACHVPFRHAITGGQCRARRWRWPTVGNGPACVRGRPGQVPLSTPVSPAESGIDDRVEDGGVWPAFRRIDGPGGGRIAVQGRGDRPAAMGCLRVVGNRAAARQRPSARTIRRPERPARGSR